MRALQQYLAVMREAQRFVLLIPEYDVSSTSNQQPTPRCHIFVALFLAAHFKRRRTNGLYGIAIRIYCRHEHELRPFRPTSFAKTPAELHFALFKLDKSFWTDIFWTNPKSIGIGRKLARQIFPDISSGLRSRTGMETSVDVFISTS